jgi:hypothetical protein
VKTWETLANRRNILGLFLLYQVTLAVYPVISTVNAIGYLPALLFKVIALPVLFFYSYKGSKVANILLSVIVTCYGIGALIIGAFIMGAAQWPLKFLAVLVGIYFTGGGLWLIRESIGQQRRTS